MKIPWFPYFLGTIFLQMQGNVIYECLHLLNVSWVDKSESLCGNKNLKRFTYLKTPKIFFFSLCATQSPVSSQQGIVMEDMKWDNDA